MASVKLNAGKGEYMSENRETKSQPLLKGLTTEEGLCKLHEAIQKELENHENEQRAGNMHPFQPNSWFLDAYHHNSSYTTFSWPCALVLLIAAILLLVCYAQKDDLRFGYIPMEVIIIFAVVVANIYLVGTDSKLRHCELLHKATNLLKYLEKCIQTCDWKPSHYPQLNMPLSPCITLQWTYRDGILVNLHWSLLVEGDVIVLRPGQVVPSKCYSLEDSADPKYKFGDEFAPPQDIPQEAFTTPQIRTPFSNKEYVLLETPYIRSLRLALQQSRHRPLSFFDKERHIIMTRYLQQIVIPILLAIMLLVNSLRYTYMWQFVGHWTDMIVILQIEAVLPLLPLAFPLCWILLNAYGMTRLIALFTLAKQAQLFEVALDELGEAPVGPHPSVDISWQHIKEHICDIIWGKNDTLCRTANLLHVFGSVTNLSCIDKKGILSWPNPTPEKVFFLKMGGSTGSGEMLGLAAKDFSEDSLQDYYLDKDGILSDSLAKESSQSEVNEPQPLQLQYSGDNCFDNGYIQESHVEVLDLTHNNKVPFKVQFDDPKWKQHIHSLKPLGLAILLNTCNPGTQDHYTHFSSHIACEALHNDVVVPVVSRRCLCELARQIGFTEQALDIFQLQQHLSMFRDVQLEQVRRDKLARSLPNSKVKFPFPHMASVVLKELSTGMLQLMSQGTGDIILDSCSDFWDGQDLCPLSESDRKKILDFYHRTSLTSYCSGFAYRPLSSEISDDLSDVYLEIPADSGRLYSSLWSPSPPRSWDVPAADSRMKVMSRCLSSDSLLGHAMQESEPINDANSCFEVQCNQVFIGMVAMQYQARTDMVHLIEQLDKACVRFVHFSKENELRSRVFSEKMGLESGWNCHISLLTQRTRSESGNSAKASKSSLSRKPPSTDDILFNIEGHKSPKMRSTLESMRQLSVSAPSAINLDVTTVKFEEEISVHNVTIVETTSESSDKEHCSRSPQWQRTASGLSQNEDDSRENITDALINQRGCESIEDCGHLSRSPSHVTESTEQSVPITFDMSNRAKLPKGIANIRPHLENIDNVPLLVSLFTDCTADATIEMIKIMQEYGEVVCCLGSSASCYNMPLFMQADASIAVEPLYPQLCAQQPSFESVPEDFPLPVEISHHLNSLSCSLSFYREDPVSIYHLVMEARHFTIAMHNCFQFFLSSSLSLSILILLSCILLLPPPISLPHIIVFVVLTIPLLSMSLIACPLDQQIMTLATAKNTHIITMEAFLSFLGYCGARFLPSVAVCLLSFGVTMYAFCLNLPLQREMLLVNETDNKDVCSLLLGNINYSKPYTWNGWSDEYASNLCVAQNLTALMLCIYFVCISANFVHQSHQLWQRNPIVNRIWGIVAAAVIIFQVTYCAIDLHLRGTGSLTVNYPGLSAVPTIVWLVSCLWPICVLAINEVVKRHKIKVDVRYQKRAKLEFGTKLGMNSPF